jgi:hypothetical protein
MNSSLIRSRERCFFAAWIRIGAFASVSALTLALSLPSTAQQPASSPAPAPAADTQPPATQPAEKQVDTPAADHPSAVPDSPPTAVEAPKAAGQEPAGATLAPAAVAAPTTPANPVTEVSQAESLNEEQLRQQLVGKPLYLRGGYLDNSLNFDEHGRLVSHSPQGSFTLSAIEIEKVRLTKHKVELEGLRYGLHFLGALPYEDPASALDRVRITPKKKVVKITIDREIVVTPKKPKEPKAAQKTAGKTAQSTDPGDEGSWHLPWGHKNKDQAASAAPKPAEKNDASAAPAAPAPEKSAADAAPATAQAPEKSPADQLAASIAAAPEAERPADEKSVTTTISPAHAAAVLKDALDKIFAQGLDERMMAAMPDFWKLYYKAVSAKTDYRPADPAVLRQNTVDTKARLLSTFEPASNEYAQANAVAGMALYHTIVGADGKPGEVAVGRPIGFGLDENAVDSIRKAKFQPAIKDGKPVPVMLDLVVQFRIYSKRTAVAGAGETGDKPSEPVLPGPYSVLHK